MQAPDSDAELSAEDEEAALVTLSTFLVSIDPAYKKYATRLYPAYQTVLEVASAQVQDLVHRKIRQGPAGVIIHAAKTQAGGQSASADTLDKLAALVPFLQAMVTKITLRPDSSKSTARQLRLAAFKLGLYRYYYNSTAADVPPQLKCMVTGMMLSAKLVIAAHLIPRAHPEVAAIVCNIADVDSPRNGLLWAGPVEKAWTEHEIAFIPDKETRQLKFRVLTQSLMTTRLMDYNNQANLGETFGDHQFSAYDNTALLVQPGATPYRRALLLQAVNAVSQHAAAGDLRAGITCSAADFEVESDFENRPAVEAWVCSTLS